MLELAVLGSAVLVPVWALSLVFGLDPSFTIAFAVLLTPVFVQIGALGVIRGRTRVLDADLAVLLAAGIGICFISGGFGLLAARSGTSKEHLFNVASGAMAFALPLALLLRDRPLANWVLLGSGWFLYVSNVVAAVAQIVLLARGILTPGMFWAYSRYSAILYHGQVRIPGIFTSGAGNGLFLLTVSAVLGARLLIGRPLSRLARWAIYAALVLNGYLIGMTYTRKVYVMAVLVTAALAIAAIRARATARNRKAFTGALGLGAAVAAVIAGVAGVSMVVPSILDIDLLSADTIFKRIAGWAYYLDRFGGDSVYWLIGANETQTGATLSHNSMPLIDNLALALTQYGGIVFLTFWILLLLTVTGKLWRAARRLGPNDWLPLAALISVGLFVFNGFFEATWVAAGGSLYLYVLWVAAVTADRNARSIAPSSVAAAGPSPHFQSLKGYP